MDSHGMTTEREDRIRLDAFRLGKSSSSASHSSKPSHGRAHSRNKSLSMPMSISLPTTLGSSPPTPPTDQDSDVPPSPPPAKRTSHHRRRSSVSTRRESADMMGLPVPSEHVPTPAEDMNASLGDRDSLRRRALLALEGKSRMGVFAPVAIPQLDADESDEPPRGSFELPTKPSFPPGIGAGPSAGISSLLGSKRDSLGKYTVAAPCKDPLGTLVEEDEDEDEEPEEHEPVLPQRVERKTAPVRHRPASLNLRPLALSPTISSELPTPSPTPSPRPGLRSLTLPSITSVSDKRQASVIVPVRRQSVSSDEGVMNAPPRRRSVVYVTGSHSQPPLPEHSSATPPPTLAQLPTPDLTPTSASAHPSAATDLPPSAGRPLSASEQHFLVHAHTALVQRIAELEKALASRPPSRSGSAASTRFPGRRSMSASRYSITSASSTASASDVDAEADVSATSSDAFDPFGSADSGQSNSAALDELLLVIADLKAERDELRRDVDGWRTRVAGLETARGVLAARVEGARREAWVARERVGILEAEARNAERTRVELAAVKMEAGEKERECEALRGEASRLEAVVERLMAQAKQKDDEIMRSNEERIMWEQECARLRKLADEERTHRAELEHELESAGLLDTPRAFEQVAAVGQIRGPKVSRTMMYAKARGLGFRSLDSEGSCTDVESVMDSPRDKLEFGLADSSRYGFVRELRAVEEEDEYSDMEDEDELAEYSREDDCDAYVSASSSSSSFSYPRAGPAVSVPVLTLPPKPSSPVPPSAPQQVHARHASLSKAWTFPLTLPAAPQSAPAEIDRFFGCLEDVDSSPPLPPTESGRTLFARALAESHDDSDDLPPFVLPTDVGFELDVTVQHQTIETEHDQDEAVEKRHVLEVVVEEDEDEDEDADVGPLANVEEFVGEEDEGGIKFVFDPPPPEYSVHDEPVGAAPTPDTPQRPSSAPFIEPVDDTTPESTPVPQTPVRRPSSATSPPSPSSLPRLTSRKSFASSIPVLSGSTPSRACPSSTLVARTSPTTSTLQTPPPKFAAPSFIPQPPPLPTKPAPAHAVSTPKRSRPSAIPIMSPPNDDRSMGTRSAQPYASPMMTCPRRLERSPAGINERLDNCPVPAPPSPSLISPILPSRLSLKTLTNFISVPALPWSPRSVRPSQSPATIIMSPVPEYSSTSSRNNDVFGSSPSSSIPVISNSTTRHSQPVQTSAAQRRFVPKERQLERLKLRMEEERRLVACGQRPEPRDGLVHL